MIDIVDEIRQLHVLTTGRALSGFFAKDLEVHDVPEREFRDIEMDADAKIQKYLAMRLSGSPIAALIVHQNTPLAGRASQSLTLELRGDGRTVSVVFTGLRDFRLADLHPGSLSFLQISLIAQDQMEGLRYRVVNTERI